MTEYQQIKPCIMKDQNNNKFEAVKPFIFGLVETKTNKAGDTKTTSLVLLSKPLKGAERTHPIFKDIKVATAKQLEQAVNENPSLDEFYIKTPKDWIPPTN